MSELKTTIRIENLTTGYKSKKGDVVITRDINSILYGGKLTCLLGPNGAGKSTLLKTLSGFLPLLSGNVFVEGKNLHEYKDSELAKVIGVVLTERIRLNNMSVYELIAMGRSPYTGFWGRLNPEDKRIVAEAISLVNIGALRDRMIDTLSDGERQKVMIAKALAQETPVILLDEPTAFLDYPSKVEIMQLLRNLSRVKGKTVFISTHDLELALQIADEIWLIDKEFGVKTGTPEDLSINGDLGNYFKREGIEFDKYSGNFHISNKLERDIRLEGDDDICRLVGKALARNGIRGAKNIDSKDIITVKEKGYIYNGEYCDSIESLLRAVL